MTRSPGTLGALLLVGALGLVRCAAAPRPAPPGLGDAFALRDPRAGAPAALLPAEERRLSEGLAELGRGETARARRRLAKGERRPAAAPLFHLGTLYADLVEGRVEGVAGALDALLAAAPQWTAALETRADLAAREGDERGALETYRRALRTMPDDPRLKARVDELKGSLSVRLSDEAEAALERRDLEAVRRSGLALLEIDPEGPAGYRVLAEAAAGAERWDDAWGFASRAHALASGDVAWTERTAEIASRSGRHGEAAALYEALAASDEAAAGKAESERSAFRLQTLPENARRAALSPKLTRAQAAALAYWLVPEVRDTPVPVGTEVATDVVDRPDRTELVRAIALGLLNVSETHRVNPENVLGKIELGIFLRRLAALAARGGRVPACLLPEAPSGALVECGILRDSSGRSTTGGEAVGAVERAVRAGREGVLR